MDGMQGGIQSVPAARASMSSLTAPHEHQHHHHHRQHPHGQQQQQELSGGDGANATGASGGAVRQTPIGSQSFAVIHAENGTEPVDLVRVVALKDVNFKVPQGSLAAVVGPVGSGV